MITIQIQASRTYDVKIGSGLLATIGDHIQKLCHPKKAAIISDSNVFPLYGQAVTKALSDAGLEVFQYVFPAGEESKNGTVYLDLVNFLAEKKMTRSDCLVALGGGVVGDMTGFAAATFLRGIPYIQVPTTLLAAVDSSVGGKTAIDLPAGKNLCGAFYQPTLVLCDTDTLNTLPEEIFRDGCAEVIKYAILFDAELFAQLRQDGINFDRKTVIARCVELKRNVVMNDEFDTGERMKLNLGHTVGHGIEAASRFEISHGTAVAMGTGIIARASSAHQLCSTATLNGIIDILQRFNLPTNCAFSAEALIDSMLSDKKRSGNTVNLIIPRAIGQCDITPFPVETLLSFIKEGL